MPISSFRMIAVLTEAEAFRDSFDSLADGLRAYIKMARAGQVGGLDEFCALLENDILLNLPRPRGERILLERSHFTRNERRITYERERQRSKRGLGDRVTEANSQYSHHSPRKQNDILPSAERLLELSAADQARGRKLGVGTEDDIFGPADSLDDRMMGTQLPHITQSAIADSLSVLERPLEELSPEELVLRKQLEGDMEDLG